MAKKVKGFFLKPSETFRATQAESLNSAFRYYVLLLILFSVLLFIVISASLDVTLYMGAVTGVLGRNGAGTIGAILPFLVAYLHFLPYFVFVISLFGIFLSGFYYHVFVILFGGHKGVTQTVKAVMYASTPAFVLGWIPVVSIIGNIWTLILIIIGIRENQGMTTGRAILVVVVPIVLTILFMVGMFAVIGSLGHAIEALGG